MVIMQKSGGSKYSITSSVLGNDSERSTYETASDGFEVRIKVRKPYTISKQREKWTEEEHQKFIKAIKLYGRAWRLIEEYIGTKTAVQIRSHAQKFFSKVAKEGSDSTEGLVEPVEIPPPRPKRKSLHPYPRKFVETSNDAKTCRSFHESGTSTGLKTVKRELHSPTSVLAPEGSQIYISSAKDLGSGSASAMSPDSSLQKTVKEISHIESSKNKGGHLESGIKVASLKTIKLFGHTVVVSNPLEYSVDQLVSGGVEIQDKKSSWEKHSSNGISSTALNRTSVIKMKNQVTNQDYADSVTEFNLLKNYTKGFVPYIRCASDREVVSLMNHMEDRRSQHVYL